MATDDDDDDDDDDDEAEVTTATRLSAAGPIRGTQKQR